MGVRGSSQKHYSDQDKANALVVLARSGGNIKAAALQLGIPRKTLSDWARGLHVAPVAIKQAEEVKRTLVDKYEELAELGIDATIASFRAIKGIEPERALDIAERAVKTARLLKGEPTSISEQGTPTQYKEKLEALRAVRAKRDERRLSKVS